MKLSEDFRDLLAAFDNASVQYLLIGGYAVSLLSKPRSTKDIDIWIGSDEKNIARAATALEAFGAPAEAVRNLALCGPEDIVWFGSPPGRVDIFKSLGVLDFSAAYARRVQVVAEGQSICVISREDLIVAKEAAGRPRDLDDIKTLRRT